MDKFVNSYMESYPPVAYFSMEVGIDPSMPTYSGGLGVLAGDTLRAAADLGVPMVGITLLHRKGYFRQHLDARGNQKESPAIWYPERILEPMKARVSVYIDGRQIQIRAWRYVIRGSAGHSVDVYFLDTYLPENSEWDQKLTDHLYGGDGWYRFCQEVVLGLGGILMLRTLGYKDIKVYHMNEGHSALLGLALLRELKEKNGLGSVTEDDIESVRQHCVFTTHTPVPVAHEKFHLDLVRKALDEEMIKVLHKSDCCIGEALNMTSLALYFSRYINGVSMRHEEISQSMFPNYPVDSITNGVHAVTWTSEPFQRLYDQYVSGWRRDNLYLRYAMKIPLKEIQKTHALAKQELFKEVKRRTGVQFDPKVLTFGFARRATPYKRADLLFSDLDRLKWIAKQIGPLQIIYGGKSHPKDEDGKALIRRVFEAAAALTDTLRVVYLEEYDMALGKYLCAGVDVWLNTPQRPQEASGTSGMKAALNGVPSFSVLDGWWVEGCIEGVTGWAIGDPSEAESNPSQDIVSLYDKLEHTIVPMFYERPNQFAEIMRSAISYNGSFFNAQRMVFQYIKNAYLSYNGFPAQG